MCVHGRGSINALIVGCEVQFNGGGGGGVPWQSNKVSLPHAYYTASVTFELSIVVSKQAFGVTWAGPLLS